MRITSLLLVGIALVSGACFSFNQPDGGPADAGAGSSGVAGRILVAGSASADAHDREVRAAVARAMGQAGAPIVDGVAVEKIPAPPLHPTTRAPVLSRQVAPLAKSKRAPEWLPGELIFQMEKHAYSRAELAEVARAMLVDAGERPYDVEVTSCTAGVMCLLTFTEDGKPLSLPATRDLETALHDVRRPGIKVVSCNYLKYALRVPNDEYYYGQQWHYEWARMPTAWDITTGDPNMIVAVVDTGLVVNHPDIATRVAQGVDMISAVNVAGDGNGRDTDPTDVGDQSWGNGQSSFHGTHVAGTIAAETDNAEGVSAVTWQGRVQPVRVLGIGSAGSGFDILSGVYWAVGETDVQDVPLNATPARVVNLSLGGPATPNDSQVWLDNMDIILNQEPGKYGNPVILAAAGNEDQTVDNVTPANIPGLIVVGAHRFDGQRASYSNWGANVSFMAPGGETGLDQNQDGYPDGIYSLYGSGFVFQQGTSMATPHVSGIAALILAVNPTLNHAGVMNLLKQTSSPAGQCNEGCGTGHVDASQALLAAGGTALPTPNLAVDRSRVFFAEGVTTGVVGVYNIGTGDLTFAASIVGPQAGLFTVAPNAYTLPSQSGVELVVTLNRNGYEAGAANLRIVGQGEAANQEAYVDLTFTEVPVTQARPVNAVQVAAFQRDDDGISFVQRGEAVLTRADVDFAYEIWGLEAGDHYVFAVGDDNNDGVFDPQTESFGAWPVSSDPRPITIADLTLYTEVNFGLTGGLVLETTGGVGDRCQSDDDCTFAADAVCVTDWNGGYCTRECVDGYCGGTGSCEELTCDGQACYVCLAACASDTQCRIADGFVCDNYQTCTPEGF